MAKDVIIQKVESSLKEWREQEKTALQLLQVVGELRFDRSIDLILFRRDIYDTPPSSILKNIKYSGKYTDKEVTIESLLTLAQSIANAPNMPSARIDLGKLGVEWAIENDKYDNVDDFIGYKLSDFINKEPINQDAKDVVLYGFGRIGRLLARRILSITGGGEQLRLRAIVIRPKMSDRYEEACKRAALLETDSVHGDFQGTVEVTPDGSEIIVNGNRIQLIYAGSPTDIDYTEYGINDALVIDNTGVWRDKEALSIHLRPGASQVMLTAPGKDMPNIVHGVNHKEYDLEKENVFCAASCTTNAISPVLKVLNEKLKVEHGHIETIHAYTGDQNLLDNFHKKPRRGRGAALNMVLTSTGAAKAVGKVLPELNGLLTGNAVRVPTPDVSLAILSLKVSKETNADDLNNMLRHAAFHGNLIEQIHFSADTEFVSSNAVGMTTTSVVDSPSTIVSPDGMNLTIYLWYDNEFGYACQVVRLAKYAAKVRRHFYY